MLDKYLISKFLIFNGSGSLTNILPSSNGKIPSSFPHSTLLASAADVEEIC